MICQDKLTPEQIAASKRNCLWYSTINGMSYMCLGETVIILFAIKLNAPNQVIAVLGSMIYFGFLLLPLGKILTARNGAAQCQADCWVLRNLSGLIVAAAAPIAVYVNQYIALVFLLFGSFCFYGFRAAGVVMSQPLMGEICEPEKQGSFIAINSVLFYIAGMVNLIMISIFLKLSSSLWVMTGIIILGAAFGITASVFLRRICETPAIQKSAQKPVKETFRKVLADRSIRHQLWAGMMCNLLIILTAPISMLALKRGYHVSDTQALLYSLVQFGAMVTVGYFQAKIAGKIGPRLLLIIGYWIFPFICLFWIFVPVNVHPLFLIVPFIFCGAASIIIGNAMTFYFLMSVKKELQVVASMIISTVSGVGSGLAGMLLGSLMLKWSAKLNHTATSLNDYRIFYIMVTILFILGCFFVHRLNKVIDTYRDKHGEDRVQKIVKSTAAQK